MNTWLWKTIHLTTTMMILAMMTMKDQILTTTIQIMMAVAPLAGKMAVHVEVEEEMMLPQLNHQCRHR